MPTPAASCCVEKGLKRRYQSFWWYRTFARGVHWQTPELIFLLDICLAIGTPPKETWESYVHLDDQPISV